MDDCILPRRCSFGSSLNHPNVRGPGMRDKPLERLLTCEQALLFRRVKWVLREHASKQQSRKGQCSRETRFTYPNWRACSQAKRLHGRLMKDVMRPRLFKSWIALSTGQITIQRISKKGNQLRFHWIEIYQVDSQVIHLSNNRGQDDKHPLMKDVNTAQQRFFSLLIDLMHIHLAWCDFCRFQIVLKNF